MRLRMFYVAVLSECLSVALEPLAASGTPQTTTAVRYRNWHLDDRKENPIRAWNPYDGTPRRGDLPAAHDFYLTCEVEAGAATGASHPKWRQVNILTPLPGYARSREITAWFNQSSLAEDPPPLRGPIR